MPLDISLSNDKTFELATIVHICFYLKESVEFPKEES